MKAIRLFLVGAVAMSVSSCAAAALAGMAGVGLAARGHLTFTDERVIKETPNSNSANRDLIVHGTVIYRTGKLGGEKFFNLGYRQVEMKIFDAQKKTLLTLHVTPRDTTGNLFTALPVGVAVPFRVRVPGSKELLAQATSAKLTNASIWAKDKGPQTVP